MSIRSVLRIASVVALLQGLVHGFAIASYAPHHGPAEVAVLGAMRAQYFHFGGPWAHSYWELYSGYAWLAAVNCFIEAAVFWIIAPWSDAVRISLLLWLFVVANLVHAALVLRFFFLTPLVPDLIVIACLVFALAQRQTRASRAEPSPNCGDAITS